MPQGELRAGFRHLASLPGGPSSWKLGCVGCGAQGVKTEWVQRLEMGAGDTGDVRLPPGFKEWEEGVCRTERSSGNVGGCASNAGDKQKSPQPVWWTPA